ncbi:MAG TPA: hypothetical protein VFQ95_04870 [Rhodanobacteraceae bacterium]|nr:hypothetical protein [Rhodanobacteraceae bacterium]
MANQVWLAYIGAIGGLVGALAGIGGLVLAILAFRRTGQLKALDMRLELRRCYRLLRSDAEGIAAFLKGAKGQYLQALANMGNYQSSAKQQWLTEWGADFVHAEAFAKQVASFEMRAQSNSQAQLEAQLNAVQDLQHQLGAIASKYGAAHS